jgi:pullulanase
VRLAHERRFVHDAAQCPAESEHADASERMLVIGVELAEPHALLDQHCVDALWHHRFMSYIRAAVTGRHHEDEMVSTRSFEDTVRKAIDARLWGFKDLSQAVIYLSSHRVEGYRNERFATYLSYCGITEPKDVARRVILAFACLLTAVGTPMILAGDEFAEGHVHFDAMGHVADRDVAPSVTFALLEEAWRASVKDAVARLISARTTLTALSVNDVDFIHADFTEGKRVIAWRRGVARSSEQVVVVANFSSFETPGEIQVTNRDLIALVAHTGSGRLLG